MTIGWPSEQTSSVSSVVKSLRFSSLLFRSTSADERLVERRAAAAPTARLAAGDLVEVLLHARGEVEVDEVAEVLDEQVGDDLADVLGPQPALHHRHVAAIDDRRDRRGVGRRPADAVLLERLDQRRLGVARRRLGEVLRRRDLVARSCASPSRSAGSVRSGLLGRVVGSLGVDAREAVEDGPRGARAQLVACRPSARPSSSPAPSPPSATRARAARSGGRAAARRRRASLGERVRIAREARRPDRLVRLLGALALRRVDAALAAPRSAGRSASRRRPRASRSAPRWPSSVESVRM